MIMGYAYGPGANSVFYEQAPTAQGGSPLNIMLTQAARGTVAIALGFLVGACVRVGHIQQTEPIRTLNFTGSHKAVAQCLQQRLGGQVLEESFLDRYVIYDSVKGEQHIYGITHYSVTVTRISANEGVVTWRAVRPPEAAPGGPRREPSSGDPLAAAAQKYWTAVERCVDQAKAKP